MSDNNNLLIYGKYYDEDKFPAKLKKLIFRLGERQKPNKLLPDV